MTESRIIISLIVPTYNAAAWLTECVTSVTGQLPDNCELILVDDGSSDGTAQAVCRYAEERSNITAIPRAHGGVSAARNAGLDAARGAYIAFLDCDDCLKEDFFSQGLRLIESGADLYIGGFEHVDPDKTTPMALADKIYDTASDFADDYIRNRHLLVYSACNKFYKNSIIKEYGIRFERGLSFGEDRLFNFEYLRHCGRIETSHMIMFRYIHRNADSASYKKFPDQEKTVLRLHRAKMDCFLNLSKGTTEEEKNSFIRYDRETERTRLLKYYSLADLHEFL